MGRDDAPLVIPPSGRACEAPNRTHPISRFASLGCPDRVVLTRQRPTGSVPRMIVAIVRFALPTPMTIDEARATFEAGAPAYQVVPGLRRKHYLLAENGILAGGIYLWDSKEQAEAMYNDEWRERLTKRYGATPTVEYFLSPLTLDPTSITTD
jgi:hypothetical protein